jgi:hypothetical protein
LEFNLRFLFFEDGNFDIDHCNILLPAKRLPISCARKRDGCRQYKFFVEDVVSDAAYNNNINQLHKFSSFEISMGFAWVSFPLGKPDGSV